MSKKQIPVSMKTSMGTIARKNKKGELKCTEQTCLIVGNIGDNSITISMRENAGIIMKVKFDTMATVIASEIARKNEEEAREKEERGENTEDTDKAEEKN